MMKNVMDLVENDVFANGKVVADMDFSGWELDNQVVAIFDDGSFQCYWSDDVVAMGGAEFACPN